MQSIKIKERTFLPKVEGNQDFRSRDRKAVIYDEAGKIKSIYLNEIQKIKTSVGTIDCEMVTFYPNGNLHRVFPTYAKISGFWSEEEEGERLEPLTIHTPFYEFRAKISCFCFYPDESIKSITLWPGETVQIEKNDMKIRVRYGLSFYPNGALKSVEPALPVKVEHKTGIYHAFDFMATGVTGDKTSLNFYENGDLLSLKSNMTGISITDKEGKKQTFLPQLMTNPFDIDSEILMPVEYQFEKEGICFTDSVGNVWHFLYDSFQIEAIKPSHNTFEMCKDTCSGQCSSCNK